jgi:excinuclease ABC subunit C
MLKQKLETIPNKPGIYKFLDKKGKILYVGKATNLKNRVSSYFNNSVQDRPRIVQMLPLVKDIQVIETNDDIEALILESGLIKKYKPKYNSDLKDDKSYAWIYITTKDEYPTVKIVRNISKNELNKGKIFGPYPNGTSVKVLFKYLRKLYPFCNCCKPSDARPSIYFDLGLCPGPYHGHITKEEYRENINNIVEFLKGKKKNTIKELEQEMKEYSIQQRYEDAQELRDKISDLRYLNSNIRFSYEDTAETYLEKRKIALKKSLENISNDLSIPIPEKIECYDISNIQGKNAYGSLVVATEGEINRNMYRIFKIKEKDTPDDFGMLKEVLERRLKNIGKNADESLSNAPDLILVDGGKGHLGKLFNTIPEDITLLGISKGKRLKRKGSKQIDEFWIRRDGDIKQVKIKDPSLLINLRDEAHRFAIGHHRRARRKETVSSELEKITGVGEKRRKLLLKEFRSVENIKKKSVEELNRVVKNRKITEEIFKYFKR